VTNLLERGAVFRFMQSQAYKDSIANLFNNINPRLSSSFRMDSASQFGQDGGLNISRMSDIRAGQSTGELKAENNGKAKESLLTENGVLALG